MREQGDNTTTEIVPGGGIIKNKETRETIIGEG